MINLITGIVAAAEAATAIKIVWSCAKGKYQEALLGGYERWSGAGLRGRAREFSGRYAASRSALLERIRQELPSGWRARLPQCYRYNQQLRLVLDAPNGTTYDWVTGRALTAVDMEGLDAMSVAEAERYQRRVIRERALQELRDHYRLEMSKGWHYARAWEASDSARERAFVRGLLMGRLQNLDWDGEAIRAALPGQQPGASIERFLSELPDELREDARLLLAERLLAS